MSRPAPEPLDGATTADERDQRIAHALADRAARASRDRAEARRRQRAAVARLLASRT